ncbi:16576_t:CDS:2 [Funneliformis mosseae]|uniref:16576_t:CDS:1 n=1 Tax=Funneliformis mosseae TaxID=27381 RepID=A0A9N8V6N6_FUNMO|nr:16576_t:CDS:2 [Funneliformis mosseae]
MNSFSLIVILINSPLIFSQEIDLGDRDDSRCTTAKCIITFIFLILILFTITICCFYSIHKKRQKLKSITNATSKSVTVDTTTNAMSQSVSSKSTELDLENNWITDVYSNKDLLGLKKKFYNFDNDSLQSVRLSPEDKKNTSITNGAKGGNLSHVVVSPPNAYHPISPIVASPPANSTHTSPPVKDLTAKALEFLIKNPPKDVLPSQEEVHSIFKVHENIYLNPYSSWKFAIGANVVEESGVVQITNYGKLVEINTRKWSSVTNNVCVQSNYPFFIPKSSTIRRNSISSTIDRAQGTTNPNTHVKRNSNKVNEDVMHYFEVTVVSKATDVDTIISIGLSTKPFPYFRLPGWNKHSVGYQSNDGHLYHNEISSSREYGPTYNVGDIIGCGYKPSTKEVFFTKNGNYLGAYAPSRNPFIEPKDDENSLDHVWYPTIAANGQCKLEINFGGDIVKDIFKYRLARNFGPGAPLSIVKQLRGGELIGSFEKCKSENVELEQKRVKFVEAPTTEKRVKRTPHRRRTPYAWDDQLRPIFNDEKVDKKEKGNK